MPQCPRPVEDRRTWRSAGDSPALRVRGVVTSGGQPQGHSTSVADRGRGVSMRRRPRSGSAGGSASHRGHLRPPGLKLPCSGTRRTVPKGKMSSHDSSASVASGEIQPRRSGDVNLHMISRSSDGTSKLLPVARKMLAPCARSSPRRLPQTPARVISRPAGNGKRRSGSTYSITVARTSTCYSIDATEASGSTPMRPTSAEFCPATASAVEARRRSRA